MFIPNSILYFLISNQFFSKNKYLKTEEALFFDKQGSGSSNTSNLKD